MSVDDKLNMVCAVMERCFPRYTVTKVKDLGDSCVVSFCDDSGEIPLCPPIEISAEYGVSYYDMTDPENQEALKSGAVIYEDYSQLRTKQAKNE